MTKTKQPCQTPGCNWPNWHVCLVGKPDSFPTLLNEEAKAEPKSRGPRGTYSDAHRLSLSLAQQERWDRIHEENKARNDRVVDRYAEGDIAVRQLMVEFKIGYGTVLKILHAAQEDGRITMRKRGQSLATSVK